MTQIKITRDNVDELLDNRRIETNVAATGEWWLIKRNGRTWHGVREPHRIRIPFKAGIGVWGYITNEDFLPEGYLNPARFRAKP